MHVDASWGGPAILSTNRKNLIKGIELSDSLTWNPHKGMGIPVQCSALILNNHKGALERSNSSKAEYLFQKSLGSEYDMGDKTLTCGRKNDVLKLWLSFKKHGIEKYRRRIDRALENADNFAYLIKKRGDIFALVEEPTYVNVCFWYIPKHLRSKFEKYGPSHESVY